MSITIFGKQQKTAGEYKTIQQAKISKVKQDAMRLWNYLNPPLPEYASGPLGGTKKALDLVKLYRGVPQWFRKTMVKDGMHVGGGGKFMNHPKFKPQPSPKLHTTRSQDLAEHYGSGLTRGGESATDPRLLEYRVPRSEMPKTPDYETEIIFEKGLPAKYLHKVSKLKLNKRLDKLQKKLYKKGIIKDL